MHLRPRIVLIGVLLLIAGCTTQTVTIPQPPPVQYAP